MLAMLWEAMCWGWALAKDLPYTSLSLLSNYPKTFSTIAGVSRDPGVKGGREGHSTGQMAKEISASRSLT